MMTCHVVAFTKTNKSNGISAAGNPLPPYKGGYGGTPAEGGFLSLFFHFACIWQINLRL